MRSWACWAISAPWSQVSERRSCSGSVVILAAIASRTASAPCPASAGPFSTRALAVAVHARQVQQHREPGGALDQCPDRRAVQSDDQIAFPVARHRPVGGFGRALADHDLRADEVPAAPARAGPRHAQRPPGAQARGQLAAQRAAALDVERLIDRLVADPHRLIIGEVHPQPVGDLLRTPRPGPAALLPAAVTAPDPAHLRPRHRRAVGRGDHDRRGDPARSRATSHWRPAWPSSGAERAGRPATAPSWPDTRTRRPASPRCGASSREIVDGARPTRRAISRTPQPLARRIAISSRSANDR